MIQLNEQILISMGHCFLSNGRRYYAEILQCIIPAYVRESFPENRAKFFETKEVLSISCSILEKKLSVCKIYKKMESFVFQDLNCEHLAGNTIFFIILQNMIFFSSRVSSLAFGRRFSHDWKLEYWNLFIMMTELSMYTSFILTLLTVHNFTNSPHPKNRCYT